MTPEGISADQSFSYRSMQYPASNAGVDEQN